VKLLLDTHVLVWWLEDARALGRRGRRLIAEPENAIFVSSVSIWELRIKQAIGKIVLPDTFEAELANEGFESLSMTATHAHAVKDLPMYHRDPFDRMLIAQARCDDLVLLTHDAIAGRYDVQSIIL
jgi:PIN domain nuclease of toxin-antitoxin system